MVGYKEILVAIVLFFIILYYWRRNRNSPFRIWPVVGILPGILHNIGRIHDFFTEALEQGEGTLQFRGPWFSNFNLVLTSDPRNMHHILSKKFENFQRGPEFREIFEALGDGIFNSDGDLWRTQQKALHSLIKNTKFELAVQRILTQKLVQGLFPILESCPVLDMQDVFHRLTFDIICLLVLGFDPNCLSIEFPNVSCEKAYDAMEEAVLHRHVVPRGFWKLQRLLQVGEENKLRRAWETFDKFLHEQILLKHEKLSTKNSDKEEEFDLLTPFMLGEYGEKSARFLRDTAFSLLAAGRDTVAAALVWFLWLVATHPSVEEKILEEIKLNNMHVNEGSKWKTYSVKEMSKLVYLHGAVSEALRLYPPVPFDRRVSVQPDILPSGHSVGRNTKIILFLYSMGRSKEIWGEDCLEFKPQRWITEQGSIVHIPSHKFMPFLTGPRTCLGKDTAFYQIKTLALAVIQNYHVRVLENHRPVTPSPSIILKMKHGLLVRVSKRHH